MKPSFPYPYFLEKKNQNGHTERRATGLTPDILKSRRVNFIRLYAPHGTVLYASPPNVNTTTVRFNFTFTRPPHQPGAKRIHGESLNITQMYVTKAQSPRQIAKLGVQIYERETVRLARPSNPSTLSEGVPQPTPCALPSRRAASSYQRT